MGSCIKFFDTLFNRIYSFYISKDRSLSMSCCMGFLKEKSQLTSVIQ